MFKTPYKSTLASFTFVFAIASICFLRCSAIYPLLFYCAMATMITATFVTLYVLYQELTRVSG